MKVIKLGLNLTNYSVSRCDPPSVPYLGIYLSDLTFIDEGTPNRTEKNLINFAKMRMVMKIFFSLLILNIFQLRLLTSSER